MDLLYSRYASPQELIDLYISQGRFGEFVKNIIQLENERKEEEAKKDDDWRFWSMYLFSGSEKSFMVWKDEVIEHSKQKAVHGGTKDINMTDSDIEDIINKVFPGR